jgi:hypothetical protein
MNEEELIRFSNRILGYAREIIAKELFGNEVIDVEPSEGHIWNGWLIYEWGGKTFTTGGYYKFWKTIKETLAIALKEADEIVAKIEQEWEEKVGNP